MLNAVKDLMTAKAAQVYVNNQIARYGQVRDLKIDSRNKTVELTCLLQGEKDPVFVRVDRYTVHEVGGKRFVELNALSCSRPWLQNLLVDLCRGRREELPAWAAGAL